MRFRAGRAVSALHARVAQERMAAGESLESQRPVLERGLEYARTWPLLALLGDAAHDEADYGGASALYQEALAVIDDAAMTPKAPPEAGNRTDLPSRRAESDARRRLPAGSPIPLRGAERPRRRKHPGLRDQASPAADQLPYRFDGVHGPGPPRGGGHGGVPEGAGSGRGSRSSGTPIQAAPRRTTSSCRASARRRWPGTCSTRASRDRSTSSQRARPSVFPSTIRAPTRKRSGGRWTVGWS